MIMNELLSFLSLNISYHRTIYLLGIIVHVDMYRYQVFISHYVMPILYIDLVYQSTVYASYFNQGKEKAFLGLSKV